MNKEIQITALVGQSGTGKSHHAATVAAKVNAQAIIDDGLLIIGNKVAAGKSAKREPSKVLSVKRALFTDPKHTKEVRDELINNKVERLLILGTSEKMIDRIASTLEIGEVFKYIHIEDISTPEDIETARHLRREQGKHIIPVPTLEIKKDFSGYFLHPLHIFRKRKGKTESVEDKTVVRPTYSYMGSYTISDNAIAQTAAFVAGKVLGVTKVSGANVVYDKNTTVINISVSLKFGTVIPDVCKKIAHDVTAMVEKMTAINIDKINIAVKEYEK